MTELLTDKQLVEREAAYLVRDHELFFTIAENQEDELRARLREAERLLDAIQTDCDDIGKAASDAIDAYFARVRQTGA